MGKSSSSSQANQSATDARQANAGEALSTSITGDKNSQSSARDQAVVAGDKSNIDQSLKVNSGIDGGIKGNNNQITMVTTDQGAVQASFDAIADTNQAAAETSQIALYGMAALGINAQDTASEMLNSSLNASLEKDFLNAAERDSQANRQHEVNMALIDQTGATGQAAVTGGIELGKDAVAANTDIAMIGMLGAQALAEGIFTKATDAQIANNGMAFDFAAENNKGFLESTNAANARAFDYAENAGARLMDTIDQVLANNQAATLQAQQNASQTMGAANSAMSELTTKTVDKFTDVKAEQGSTSEHMNRIGLYGGIGLLGVLGLGLILKSGNSSKSVTK